MTASLKRRRGAQAEVVWPASSFDAGADADLAVDMPDIAGQAADETSIDTSGGLSLKSVYEAFDSSQPVLDPADLYGRSEQLDDLLRGVIYRRNHGVISGPRGSGKTSMVKVFGQRAEAEGVVVLYSANDSDGSFGLMMRRFLENIPSSSLSAGEGESFQVRVQALKKNSSAQDVVNLLSRLAYSAVIIIVDEFDRVPDTTFKRQISSLLKLTSDARLRVRFLLVGDERTFPDVLQEHPSLSRHMTHISTSPLSDEVTDELLSNCSQRAGLTLSQSAAGLIGETVCGSPYHARLFGLHAALRAHSQNRPEINAEDAIAGLANGFEEWSSLNPRDAALFRRLLVGGPADQPFVSAAKRLAWRKMPQLELVSDHGDGISDALEQLAPALDDDSGRRSFRDSTAAQFLIALHVARRPLIDDISKKRRTRRVDRGPELTELGEKSYS